MYKKMNTISESEFDGRYTRIGNSIGQGAFGKVYKAYDRVRKVTVALKYFSFKDRESFAREVVLLSRLKNVPHTVKFYDAWQVGLVYVLSIEYFAGKELRDLKFTRGGNRHIDQIARQGLLALQGIHKHGIVHGDIKAENILYEEKTGALIIDFGVSCLAIDVKEARKDTSGLDLLVRCKKKYVDRGTLNFFSLDRLRVGDAWNTPEESKIKLETYFKIMRKDDMFAFGVVLYELIMGKTYRPPHSTGVLLKLEVVDELLKVPDSMIPSDFKKKRNHRLYPLAVNLMTASYAKRLTATAALELLDYLGIDPSDKFSATASSSSASAGRSGSSATQNPRSTTSRSSTGGSSTAGASSSKGRVSSSSGVSSRSFKSGGGRLLSGASSDGVSLMSGGSSFLTDTPVSLRSTGEGAPRLAKSSLLSKGSPLRRTKESLRRTRTGGSSGVSLMSGGSFLTDTPVSLRSATGTRGSRFTQGGAPSSRIDSGVSVYSTGSDLDDESISL